MTEFTESFYKFIEDNKDSDTTRLMLRRHHDLPSEHLRLAVLQIELKRKFKLKFPEFITDSHTLIPDRSVAEQASSEATSRYVASLIGEHAKIADLTAGLGINSLAFSKIAGKVVSVELDEKRAKFLQHNIKALEVENVDVVHADCIDWLKKNDEVFDTIYIDPARRDNRGNRSISLASYSPDVTALMPLIRKASKRLLIKVSPLLDLAALIKELPGIGSFHLIEYLGELKEVVAELRFEEDNPSREIKIVSIEPDLSFSVEEFDFMTSDDLNRKQVELVKSASEIRSGGYIYLPSASYRKARLTEQLANRYPRLKTLSPNTLIFYSERGYEDFPGKVLEVVKLLDKRELKEMKGGYCNVLSRNYPLSSEALSAKYHLKPSGSAYMIVTTLISKEKVMILCENIGNNH